MSVRKISRLLAAFVCTLPMLAMAGENYRDVLDTPARDSAFATKSLLNGVVNTGQRVVAVGQRGHIVYSDDLGKTWQQAKVPVTSDLVAVTFPTPQKGWAVGHDGIVLHSADGGASWTRQLDGRSAGKLMTDFYAAHAGKGLAASAEAEAALLNEVDAIQRQGAENPFLDVWFADERTGFIVGAFNLIFRTDDGGKTWEPWFHRTDNASRLHLYAIRQIGDKLYAAGEQGLVLQLDAKQGRFVALDTGYKGSFFGITGQNGSVLVFGLRGNAFRSADGGRSWQKVVTGLQDAITGAAACNERGLLLVSQAGRLLVGDAQAQNFRAVTVEKPAPASAVACLGRDGAVMVGPRGVRTQQLH